MTTPWTVQLAQKTHPLFLPMVWIVSTISYFYAVFSSSDSPSWSWGTHEQAWGTALVYCLIPGYLWGCSFYLWKVTGKALDDLGALFKTPERWANRVQNPTSRYLLGWTIVGGLYGLSQTQLLIMNIQLSENRWLDCSMIVANVIMFSSIGALVSRRLYAHTGLRQAGYEVAVDLYNLHTLRPFASVALVDVLVVMGALAFMPLQSLDTEFRWVSYEAGLIIGIPSAIAFFLLPIWGVHRSIQNRQAIRLKEIQAKVNACDLDDIATLERIVAHRDRIQSIHPWPLDMRLISRAAFYLVIPPMAWIGAALVENFVERLLG